MLGLLLFITCVQQTHNDDSVSDTDEPTGKKVDTNLGAEKKSEKKNSRQRKDVEQG